MTRTRRTRTRVYLLTFVLLLYSAGSGHAASFTIVYDDVANGSIGSPVGTGTFSYDGPPVVGSFALSSLTGVSFDVSFPGVGATFSTADVVSDLDFSGIHVFGAGAGQFGLVFSGGPIVVGSLNAIDADGVLLTHEPTFAIDNPIGCCGGNGTINLYQLIDDNGAFFLFGDYRALTAVPAPSSVAVVVLGLLGIVGARVHRARRARRERTPL